MFGKKKKTQTSTDVDKLITQIERTRKINDRMLTMSLDFTNQTAKRLKEVKR